MSVIKADDLTYDSTQDSSSRDYYPYNHDDGIIETCCETSELYIQVWNAVRVDLGASTQAIRGNP